MPATKKKIALRPFRTIKFSAFVLLALYLGLFVVGGAWAGISESFETYNLGNINYQGDWFPLNKQEGYYEWGFIVNNNKASQGNQSIYSNSTSSDLIGSSELWWATTTGSGIFSFDFLVEKKPNWAMVEFCYGGIWCADIMIGDSDLKSTKITLDNYPNEDIILSENYNNNIWHRINFEYNLPDNWGRASFNGGSWSATTTLNHTPPYTPAPYFNRFIFRSGGSDLERIYFDNFRNEGECNSTCLYCDLSGCQDYESDCLWNYSENQCQPLILGLPELPALEDCSAYGVTERLLCEIKNFFYRLFVPSPEKITELKTTLDLVKTKFPYNYILAVKDFFIYLKDNINESQEITFSILGQSGTLNLSFWNTTTTLAGVNQSFLNIFKTFFKFLIVLVFVLWCFSFIKRIFK